MASPKSLIPSVMNFLDDKNAFDHAYRDYSNRLGSAYAPFGQVLERGILEIVKHTGIISEPVVIVSYPVWVAGIKKLIESSTGAPVMIVSPDDLHVAYPYGAKARNASLSASIIKSIS